MHMIPDDNAKRRLTEPDQLWAVVDYMLSHGYALDDVPIQLSRYYYLDLDLLNDILYRGATHPGLQRPSEADWRKVA